MGHTVEKLTKHDKQSWTEEELEFLKQNYKILPCEEIAAKLNKTLYSVKLKRSLLGFRKIYKPVQVGEIFGRLRVVSEADRLYGEIGRIYNCECICGNFHKAVGAELRRGN